MAVLATCTLLAGCGGGRDQAVLRVSAAASLTEVFTDLASTFEAEHEGSDVVLTFGGSPTLVTQLREGSPTDVLVTADETTMGRAVAAGDVRDPRVIARNRLVLVVEPGNPQDIDAADDLAGAGVTVAACSPAVPCGRLTEEVLAQAGVDLEPASREENVKAVLSRVVLGEVDAGLVYETDARAAGSGVERLALLPRGPDAPSTAVVAAVAVEAGEPDLAGRWLALLRSPAGRRALEAHGFRAP